MESMPLCGSILNSSSYGLPLDTSEIDYLKSSIQ